jgi:hypothetical protein
MLYRRGEGDTMKHKQRQDLHQIGKSIKQIDIKRTAFKPGKRTSNTDHIYYERRMNRSDKKKNI